VLIDLEEDRFEVGIRVAEMLDEGCWTRSEIVENLLAEFDTLDASGLNSVVDEQVAEKRKRDADYPEVTDCDRLWSAFSRLREVNVLALHTPASTRSSCYHEALLQWRDHGGVSSGLIGAAYYDPQDVEATISEGELGISFVAFSNSSGQRQPSGEAQLGHLILTTLLESGLQAEWNSDITKRVKVRMHWRKRFDAEAFGTV